jgi:tetratricopeptide (TPR) repeat protein
MRTFLVTLVIMLWTSIPSFAFAETGDALVQVKKAVQEATLTGDAAALKAARDLAQSVVQQTPHKAAALYYLGYAQYSLAVLPGEKASSEQHTDAGIAALEDAIKLDPPFADAHALLASLYGRKASGGVMAGMKYGQKSSTSMERAITLSPQNPRVLMLHGISLYFTPALWGGDKQKAIANLKKACDLAEKGACASTDAVLGAILPDWGHAEAFAWKGVMFADGKDIDNAKAAYERALQLQPQYAWVKFVLVPKLSANE